MSEPNELAGLVAAVCTEPDCDLVRGVVADWFDEHDQPERAEFIRVQLEVAALKKEDPICWAVQNGDFTCYDPECEWKRVNDRLASLRERERELLEQAQLRNSLPVRNRMLWFDPFWHRMRVDVVWRYDRGFVHLLRTTAEDFFKHADGFCWHPSRPWPCPVTAQPIREVQLTTQPQLVFTGDEHFTWEGYPCHVPDPFPKANINVELVLPHYLSATFPGIEFFELV